VKIKKNIKVRNKDYFKDGHARNKALLELMQTVNGSVTIAQLAKQLGWYGPAVKASMTFLMEAGLVEEIEVTRVSKEYVYLTERKDLSNM
jgi:predicted ArsR family transcriptional regulator